MHTRAAALEEASRSRRGAFLGNQHLHLGLPLAHLEEVVEGLLGREVGARRPLRAGLIELQPERVAQDVLGLLDRVCNDADVVDVHEAHGQQTMNQPPGVHLIVGGYPPGSTAGHDMDDVRLRLLAELSGLDGHPATVSSDYANLDRWLPPARLLVTYVAGPVPSDEDHAHLRSWLEAGGRWLALHGTSGGEGGGGGSGGGAARGGGGPGHPPPPRGVFLHHPPPQRPPPARGRPPPPPPP